VSQIDQDTSAALATIREWKNSFIHINRVPLEILSLIPTHLSSQKDRFRASLVCRHWRRTFLQCAELWSRLYLSKGEVYVKTLLERAKGSALNIVVGEAASVSTMRLLSSHIEKIKYLDVPYNRLEDIQACSEPNLECLPSLHTLTIFIDEYDNAGDVDTTTPPPPLFFSNAVDLKVFCLNSDLDLSPFPRPFVFTNLVTFSLFADPSFKLFRASGLLDFLETLPTLRTVHIKITAKVSLTDVPQERVVALPNVENLALIINDGELGYGIATHISCPAATHTSLVYEGEVGDEILDETFPASVTWNSIVRQYTRSPVEEVTLEIKTTPCVATCQLIFQSADATLIELRFDVTHADEEVEYLELEEVHYDLCTQAVRTVGLHPQLANLKRLRICHGLDFTETADLSDIAEEVWRLFRSLGPLDELTVYNCDLRPYFDPSYYPKYDIEGPNVLPLVKELTISHPLDLSDEDYTTTIVDLAKSQHARGIPFERVTIRSGSVFAGMEEGLRPWVGSVECCCD
jgi:hypothetical protein